MKKRTFFLLSGLTASVMFTVLVLVLVLMGYTFTSYSTSDGKKLRYFGTKEAGTVYYADRQASFTPGRLVYSDGDLYEGELSHYLPWGEGVYTYACGNVYRGAMAEGRPEGAGELTYVDGSTLTGLFEKGRPTEKVTLVLSYDGGEQTEVLSGEIFAAAPQRSVTYSYRNGAKYKGGYRNGLAWGEGTLTLAGGDRYEGSFDGGQMSVFGTYTYADGSVYQGQFDKGMPNGKGSYTYRFHGILRRVEGIFYNGKWIHPEDAPETTPEK